jgi:CHAT domain-containing protein
MAQPPMAAQAQDVARERARLEAALAASRERNDRKSEAQSLTELAFLDAQSGRITQAVNGFEQSAVSARAASDPATLSNALFNLAVLQARSARRGPQASWSETIGARGVVARRAPATDAARAFADAGEAALAAGDQGLAARAFAQAALRAPTQSALTRAETALGSMDRSDQRIMAAIAVADARIAARDAGVEASLDGTQAILSIAVADADALGLPALEGYARGLAARVRARSGDLAGALALTRQARFLTESAAPGASSFVWMGQEAALLSELGDTRSALAAYERASDAIASSRAVLAAGAPTQGLSSYRSVAEPILTAYADLLLRTATTADLQERLRQTRTVMESVKTLQLDQYFQDECITQLVRQRVALEDLPANVAVVYPVLLADRVEILVSAGNDIQRSPSPMARAALEVDAQALSVGLRQRTTQAWRGPSQRLYAGLIAPILPLLEQHHIDTIVFAPDGALRGLPIAALFDGQHFLIEHYSVANALSLALVDPRPLSAIQRRVLVAGVSQSVDGLPALPGVAQEAHAIAALMPGRELLDRQFTDERLTSALRSGRYSIVHLATHASFGASAGESFVLAGDRRLSLSELETIMSQARVRGEPVELLVLSACETAAGDDDAVLGIAGVAYRAGARSVLASLWSISDQATSHLMPVFYRSLSEGRLSKAQALRQAQLDLISDPNTSHPYYWSAFVLIGNWL